MKEEWQLYEQHDGDVHRIERELGMVDTGGRVRRFNGPKYFKALNELGHTHTSFQECECRKQVRKDSGG